MELTSQLQWHHSLEDPSGFRQRKPRSSGRTMVIDKGLGIRAFEDMILTSGAHIDIIKLGFGTAALYPEHILRNKIEIARANQIQIMPGGTFLEIAIHRGAVDAFMRTVIELGFNGIEVSDGTIELDRKLRSQLIRDSIENGLTVVTEYGKKCWGSKIEIQDLIETIHVDLSCGAEMVTVEGRESGAGVGMYDESGNCQEDEILKVVSQVSDPSGIMWETPQKSQQVFFLKTLGPNTNLGNIAPEEVIALEALRRGLRSDTFDLSSN